MLFNVTSFLEAAAGKGENAKRKLHKLRLSSIKLGRGLIKRSFKTI